MLSLLPIRHILRKRLLRREPKDLQSVARRAWEIAPAEDVLSTPAYCLPGQMDRVTGWAFATEHPRREMEGGLSIHHRATRAFLLEDAFLIDGVLYRGDGALHLLRRSHRMPQLQVEHELAHAAMYCSPAGNRYFGQWLIDDCATYALAAAEGDPVTTGQAVNVHTPGYEDWLGMEPLRLHSAFFRQLILFDDMGQNRHKRERFRAMSRRLLAHVEPEPHPGVFILRGATGEQRVLHNERELAELLRERRGFRILEPPKVDVPTLVATCAGARIVVGVEGSHLIHGVLALAPGAALLTLQPPNRFVSVYSHLVDGLRFGYVVGSPAGQGFRVDPVEVERTLDLFAA